MKIKKKPKQLSNPQTLDTIISYYPNTVFQTSQFVLHSFGVHLLVYSQANKKGHVFKKKRLSFGMLIRLYQMDYVHFRLRTLHTCIN